MRQRGASWGRKRRFQVGMRKKRQSTKLALSRRARGGKFPQPIEDQAFWIASPGPSDIFMNENSRAISAKPIIANKTKIACTFQKNHFKTKHLPWNRISCHADNTLNGQGKMKKAPDGAFLDKYRFISARWTTNRHRSSDIRQPTTAFCRARSNYSSRPNT